MPDTTLTDGHGTRRRTLTLIVAAAVFLGLGSFAIGAHGGSDDDGSRSDDFTVPAGVQPLGDLRAGSAASLVDCDDWNGGITERKQATVVDVREQLTAGGTVAGRPSLSDPQAFDTFERACSNEFTGSFRLYKIYYDANAFENLDPYSYGGAPAAG